MTEIKITIAIDGPAGSGKSTLSKLLSKKLNYKLVDTGAIYRCVALLVHEQHIDPNDHQALKRLMNDMVVDFKWDGKVNRVLLNNNDVTEKIRASLISQLASKYAAIPVVRKELLETQRNLAGNGGVVLEGRDIGTVVFPKAQVKFFLDASVEARAKRRVLEFKEKGQEADLEFILKEIKERDERDSKRDIAPLKPASDANIVDSTKMTIDEVLTFMLDEVTKCRKLHSASN